MSTSAKTRRKKGTVTFLKAPDEPDEEPEPEEVPPLAFIPEGEISRPLFRDGLRRIDWVLVFRKRAPPIQKYRRRYFQRSLRHEGLQLEFERGKCLEDLMFMKIFAPPHVLERNARILDLRIPFEEIQDEKMTGRKRRKFFLSFLQQGVGIGETKRLQRKSLREEYIKGWGKDEVKFPDSIRLSIVWHIMWRAHFSTNREDVGLPRLMNLKTFQAAYPLHDGDIQSGTGEMEIPQRRYLYNYWARASVFHRAQPLDRVNNYFGDEVSLYFAWLGCYTIMLIPASLLGLICVLYGLVTWSTDLASPSTDICLSNINVCMSCPNESDCKLNDLKDSCTYARISYLFCNVSTICLAAIMCIWATLLMKVWKRQHAFLSWHWNLMAADMLYESRPEYEIYTSHLRMNPILGRMEPFTPWWLLSARYFTTYFCFTLMLTIVVGVLVGIIVYKIAVYKILSTNSSLFVRENADILTSSITALFNFTIVHMLDMVYTPLAIILTNIENPRTQTEFDDRLAFKTFAFGFINNYIVLLYLTFIKGRMYTYPGDPKVFGDKLGIWSDQCDPAGCQTHLFIQLVANLVVHQILSSLTQIYKPKMAVWLRKRSKPHREDIAPPCWERDYLLIDESKFNAFSDMKDSVMQYGLVILFVSVFPLAPFCALIYNIIRIRTTAYIKLRFSQRVRPVKVAGFGTWESILWFVTVFSALTNGFIMAYTSNFVSQITYYSEKHTFKGYLNSSLSVYSTGNQTECYYPGYRYPPGNSQEYEYTDTHYKYQENRFITFVTFEHCIFILSALLMYFIPTVPQDVKLLMAHEWNEGIEARKNYISKTETENIEMNL